MDQFRGLFTKLDKNKDGFVSVEELHNEMNKHGILSRDGKVQVIFDDYRFYRYLPDSMSDFINFIFLLRISLILMTKTRMVCWITKNSSPT